MASGYQPKMDFTMMTPGEVEQVVDAELRYRPGSTPRDYLRHFLYIARHFAPVAQTDSFGEFEKGFVVMVKRLVTAEQKVERARLILAVFRQEINEIRAELARVRANRGTVR